MTLAKDKINKLKYDNNKLYKKNKLNEMPFKQYSYVGY